MDEWPSFLLDIKNYSHFAGEYCIVSEISTNNHCQRILTPALITAEHLEKLNPSEIGYMVTGSGQHPSHQTKEYEPIFWIHSSKDINLEPLVLLWESTNRTILWPDQGFLMTYGLFPRFIEAKEEIIWDEPSEPTQDVVLVKPISKYHWGNAPLAQVKIKRDFVQDYSTLRKRVIIQLFYEEKRIRIDDEIKIMMGSEKVFEAKFATHSIRIVEDSRDEELVLVEVCGYRILATPGNSPITKGRWDYGELTWPGFDKPITHNVAMTLRPLDHVYVSDSVLGKYEGHDEYDITPEIGAVSYGSQWSVSHCHRVGRNTIALELKKLYEGNSPEVVEHWHKFAVESSLIERNKKNIVEYAEELVKEYLKFGEPLLKVTAIMSRIGGFFVKLTEIKYSSLKRVVNLDNQKIDYSGCFSVKEIERITWHIPATLNKDGFLERCKRLNILIVEGLNESRLRTTILKTGVNNEKIENYGSLKLLELLLEICMISNDSGLTLLENSKAIIERIDFENINGQIKKLFALYNLRLQSSHYMGKDGEMKFNEALTSFDIELSLVKAHYVDAIEIVYQGITDSLKNINNVLTQTVTNHLSK